MNDRERRELEKPMKKWNNFRDAFDHIPKQKISAELWHQRIAERYKDGCLAIHLHAQGLLFGRPWSGCIEVHAEAEPAILISTQSATRKLDLTLPRDGTETQQEFAMLVRIYEVGEESKRPIPSVVRLNALDYADGRCWNITQTAQVSHGLRAGEFVFVADDREGNSPLLLIGQGARRGLGSEFPRDVVKSLPDIVGAVADQTTKVRRQFSGEGAVSHYFTISIESDLIGILAQIPPECFIERFQVFLSPDDFAPGSV